MSRPLLSFRAAVPALVFGVLLLGGCPAGSGGVEGTYEASNPEGKMVLEFRSGGKAKLTMQETGKDAEQAEAEYLVDGNQVTVQIAGGLPLVLVRDGKSLSTSFMGEILRFEKR